MRNGSGLLCLLLWALNFEDGGLGHETELAVSIDCLDRCGEELSLHGGRCHDLEES